MTWLMVAGIFLLLLIWLEALSVRRIAIHYRDEIFLTTAARERERQEQMLEALEEIRASQERMLNVLQDTGEHRPGRA